MINTDVLTGEQAADVIVSAARPDPAGAANFPDWHGGWPAGGPGMSLCPQRI
jgi:hypothetical protein